jgi:hypothetical protein
MLTLTDIKHDFRVGDELPMKQEYGNIGRYVEDEFARFGHDVNTGKGVDFLQYFLELKTRNEDSTSGHTVGAVSKSDIIRYDWQRGNNMFDKVQVQYRIYFRVNPLTDKTIITRCGLYDFRDEYIQSKLKESWDYCRGVFMRYEGAILDAKYIRGPDHWAYMERRPDGNYQFRIGVPHMVTMEDIANANSSKLFDFG